MRTGTHVHSHRTGPPASELRYVAAVPATSDIARARSALAHKLREGLEQRGYLEVETPIAVPFAGQEPHLRPLDRKSTRLNSSHVAISYAVFCLKKKKKND